MAFWDRISSRGNVEDRRAAGPVALGGLSLGGVALLLVLNYLAGGDPMDILSQLENVQVPAQQLNTNQFEGADSYEVFASTVLGSNNDMWQNIFAQNNRNYTPPKLVLFRTATSSSCGAATSDIGPHYCPNDGTIYLDETFFDELTQRLGAEGGDVAQAYVISHEIGHHIQNEFGIMDEVLNNSGNDSEASIKLELQADCFAGLWANSIKNLNVFEQNEFHEAQDAAAAVGDDRIQQATEGHVTPENWTHGSAEQRVNWLDRGYESGSVSACDTFN